MKPDTKATLLRAGGAPGRTVPATPVDTGTLKQMVAVAMRNEDELWRYSIHIGEETHLHCSRIRTLWEEWSEPPLERSTIKVLGVREGPTGPAVEQ